MIRRLFRRLFGAKKPEPLASTAAPKLNEPPPHDNQPWRNVRSSEQQPTQAAARQEQARSADDGFALSLATGIPLGLGAGAVVGAMVHHSLFSPPSSSISEPSGYSAGSSSYDGGSSSSSWSDISSCSSSPSDSGSCG